MRRSNNNSSSLTIGFLFGCCCLVSILTGGGRDQQVAASGVFEVNFASLVDPFGRDLREDCCAWQNESARELDELLQLDSSSSSSSSLHLKQQPCDPSKCQLIIRICVKNYQTQIDPSQCTFGELSAQVMKPSEPVVAAQFAHYPALLFSRQQQLQQQQQQQLQASRLSRRLGASQQPTNIHHQRLLSQQQQQQHQQQQYKPFKHQSHQQQQQQQQLFVSSGQSRAMRTISFFQPISFPFNFTWPGSFSLLIDAWYESPSGLREVALTGPASASLSSALAHPQHTTMYDLYKKQLIMKHSMHGWLPVKDEWTNDVRRSEQATLTYSYRVTCQPNYYGEGCNILCRPRDDLYGHYTCSPSGNIQCLAGWQGAYCLDPICSPDCHKDQGFCSRPNECQCRFGFHGPTCEECITYPGCIHGSCNRPHECICREGWGGLLCDEDLNFCANHRPCKNDAICTNAFNEQGVGSYNCTCKAGFTGTNCELSLAAASLLATQQNLTSSSAQQPVVRPSPSVRRTQQAVTSSNNNNLLIVAPSTSSSQAHVTLVGADQQQQQQLIASSEPFDGRLALIYGLFIVGMLVLIVCLFLRIFFERSSRAIRCYQESGHHSDVDADADVATLQNQQNIYKSRTSLNTDKIPLAEDLSPSGTLSSACSSRRSLAGASGAHLTSGRNHLHHQLHHQQQQQQMHNQQQASQHIYRDRSQLNINTNVNGRERPPPPYTISHQYLNSNNPRDVATYMNHSTYSLYNAQSHSSLGAATVGQYNSNNSNHIASNNIYAAGSTIYGGSTLTANSHYHHLQPLPPQPPPLPGHAALAAAAVNPYGTGANGSPYYVICQFLEVDQLAAATRAREQQENERDREREVSSFVGKSSSRSQSLSQALNTSTSACDSSTPSSSPASTPQKTYKSLKAATASNSSNSSAGKES